MSASRARVLFAGGAAAVLVLAIVLVVASGSSSDDDSRPADECLVAWNDDALARSDGVHAYSAHGYRATVLARVDERGELVGAVPETEAEGRCAVVFASPQVDREPDFGVRVLDGGRWAGLALTDGVPLERIEAMQSEATATANATLLPDGRLVEN